MLESVAFSVPLKIQRTFSGCTNNDPVSRGQDSYKNHCSTYVQLSRLRFWYGLHLLQHIDMADMRFRSDGKALYARIDDPLVKDTNQNNLEHTPHISCGNTDEPWKRTIRHINSTWQHWRPKAWWTFMGLVARRRFQLTRILMRRPEKW